MTQRLVWIQMLHYVKGQGWIEEPECDSLEFTFEGRRWLIEARFPERGELFTWSHDNNWAYTKEGKADLQGWLAYFQLIDPTKLHNTIDDMLTCEWYPDHMCPVVLTPLD